jgi:hypothetical protein
MSNWLLELKPFRSLFRKEEVHEQVHEQENPNHAWEELARWKKEWTRWTKDETQLQEDWARYYENLSCMHLDSASERKSQICRLQEDWTNWEKDWVCYQESVTRLCEEKTCLDEDFARCRKERTDEYRKVIDVHRKMVPWNFAKNDSDEWREFRARDLEIETDFQKLVNKRKGLCHLKDQLNDRQCSLEKRRHKLESRQLILTLPTFWKDDSWINHQSILKDRATELDNFLDQLNNRRTKSTALRLKLLRDPVALPWMKLIRFLQKTVEKAKTVKTPNDPGSYFPVMVAVLDFLQSFFTVGML